MNFIPFVERQKGVTVMDYVLIAAGVILAILASISALGIEFEMLYKSLSEGLAD